MKKKIISLLLCVVMVMGLLPMSALAITINPGDTLESDGIWTDPVTNYGYVYEVYQDITDHSLYAELINVTINSEAKDIALTIPGTFPYTPVGGKEQQIPLRVISGTVRWDVLRSVSIPASVEIIGANVFADQSKLEAVTFTGNSKLKTIGDKAFYYCHSLKNCTIPETVEEIGKEAFYFTSLTSVRFGAALKTLGKRAFSWCENLAELDMSAVTQLKEIPDSCFSYSSLTSLTIPNCVETIGYGAFSHEVGPNDDPGPLASLNLGNGVKTIGEYAFNGNTNLTGKLILPNSVSRIGENAFGSCGYTDVKWPEGNGEFTEVNGFYRCRSLKGTVIENLPFSVTTIGEKAFVDCIELGSVTIPGHIKTIREKAFSYAGITSLTIQYGVQTIEKNAFQSCTGLLGTEITIPASVTRLASGAFSELFTVDGYGKVAVDNPLTVKVMNPDLVLTDETYSYNYFAADDKDHTNYLYSGDAFAGCVNLILYAPAGESTAKAYADQFNGVIIQATAEDINFWYSLRTVEFHELANVPVYHTVTLPAADGVTFTVRQEGETLTPGANGTVSALHGKDVVVTAHRDGYYDQLVVRQGADFTGDWTVALGPWEALPASGRLLVNITRDGLPLGSFDGLDLTLKSGSSNVPFAVSYPYLVPAEGHGLDPDASLTLTVTPEDSMQLTGGSASSTLRLGEFTVALKGWGKADITATGTSAVPCVVLFLDGEGTTVSSGTTSGGLFTSDPLPAGTYTVVAYETNDYFGAVGSKAALSAMGLNADDYAESSVDITDGDRAELTLTVPRLNTGGLTSVLDTKKCSLAFRSNRAVTGQAFDMQVNYALKTGSAQKITFALPAGASIQSVYNEQGWLNVTDNSVTVNNSSGTLYVSLVCTGTGTKSFGASVTTGGTTLPLGSGTVTVQSIFIEQADNYTAKRSGNRISAYTTPGAVVTLTISGMEQTVAGTANAAGRVTLTYDLPDSAVDGQSYILTVTTNGGSDKTTITYFPDSARLQKFGFYHYEHEITVIDNIHPDYEDTYYTYYAFGDEKSKYFSFFAAIKSDQKLKVTVIVTMQDGSVRSVPMAQVEEANGVRKYAGELYLEGNTDDHVFHADSIPVGFGISWEDFGKVKFDGEAIYLQALQRARQQQEERESILESVNGKGIEVAPFFGYAYRTVGTQEYYDCLMTQSEYEEICAALDRLTGVESAEKEAFKENVLDQIYSTVNDCVTLAQAGDKLMDDIAEFLRQVIQLPNPLQTYDSWDGVLSDMRVSADRSSSSSQELENNGFTQVKSGWCKLGEKPNEGFTVAWPNGYDGGGQTGTGSAEPYTGNATVSVSSLKDAEGQNWADQTRTVGSHVLGNAAKLLNEQATKMAAANQHVLEWLKNSPNTTTWDDFMDEMRVRNEIAAREKLVDTQMNKARMGKALSVGAGAYNMFSDADQLNQNIVKTAESEAKASELDVLIQYYTTHVAPAGCLSALQDEKRAYELLNDLMNQKSNHLMLNVGVGMVSLAFEFTSAGVSSTAAMTYDAASGVAMYARDVEIAETNKRIEKLHAARVAACGGEGWKAAPLRSLTPILDPSGIVYEAVESNVLSGVTATIYEVSGSPILWNAGDYDQKNPLITGADGGYAWDVPSGEWQVKFTKEGYEDAETDVLTVPPPRMNLKTAMVSTAAPTVVSAAAYPNYVELVFSQYMSVTDTLTVPAGYTCEWVNREKVNAESSTEYSRVLHLKKSAAVGDSVSVTLSGAKNYAGTALADYSSGPLTVAIEPAAIRLNYETQIAVLVGEEKDPRVTVQVLDSSGQPIPGLTVTAAIEDAAYATITTVEGTTGEDGVAVFNLKGLLPGWTEASFSVEGSSLTKTMPVRVTIDSNQAAKPSATIDGNVYTESTNSIMVTKGSTLTLTCATEGAVIYYTTNDTCPCQTMDRQLYTGPITVNEDTYFRIVAYKDGMEYSERLNLRISVSDDSDSGHVPPAVIVCAVTGGILLLAFILFRATGGKKRWFKAVK